MIGEETGREDEKVVKILITWTCFASAFFSFHYLHVFFFSFFFLFLQKWSSCVLQSLCSVRCSVVFKAKAKKNFTSHHLHELGCWALLCLLVSNSQCTIRTDISWTHRLQCARMFVFSLSSDWTQNSPETQVLIFPSSRCPFPVISVCLWSRFINPGIPERFSLKFKHFPLAGEFVSCHIFFWILYATAPSLKYVLCCVWTHS